MACPIALECGVSKIDVSRHIKKSTDRIAKSPGLYLYSIRMGLPSSDNSQTGVFEPAAGVIVAGRYKLERRVGAGGMGSVWEARDKVLDCPIAIKLVPDTSDGDDGDRPITRFMREARLAASVQHPSVVRTTDFGVHEEMPFIAMELLRGQSLASHIEESGSLDPPAAVRIAIAVLRGLQAAHDAGVVHRDIKPDNVLLVGDGDAVFPKLIDFGISLGTVREKRVSAVTTNGHVFGTPTYMAPEQARGLETDGRADIYAVGIVLYEMLTGTLPFEASNPVDLMAMVVRDTAPTAHEVAPHVPKSLSRVIEKAMAKTPEERFASARDMASALSDSMPDSINPDATGPIRLMQASSGLPFESIAPIWVIGGAIAILLLAAFVATRFGSPDSKEPPAALAAEVAPNVPVEGSAVNEELEVNEPESDAPETETEEGATTESSEAPVTPVTPNMEEAETPRPTSRPTMRHSRSNMRRGGIIRQLDY